MGWFVVEGHWSEWRRLPVQSVVRLWRQPELARELMIVVAIAGAAGPPLLFVERADDKNRRPRMTKTIASDRSSFPWFDQRPSRTTLPPLHTRSFRIGPPESPFLAGADNSIISKGWLPPGDTYWVHWPEIARNHPLPYPAIVSRSPSCGALIATGSGVTFGRQMARAARSQSRSVFKTVAADRKPLGNSTQTGAAASRTTCQLVTTRP